MAAPAHRLPRGGVPEPRAPVRSLVPITVVRHRRLLAASRDTTDRVGREIRAAGSTPLRRGVERCTLGTVALLLRRDGFHRRGETDLPNAGARLQAAERHAGALAYPRRTK